MTTALWMLLIGGIAALTFGPTAARRSAERETIYGGMPAKALNLIASMVLVSAPATIITGLFNGIGLVGALVVSFSLFGVGLLLMLVFSVIESPAREQNAVKRDITKTWTEQDARSSGL